MTGSLLIASISIFVHSILVLLALHNFKFSPMLIHATSAALVHLLASAAIALGICESSYWHMAAFFWFGVMVYLFIYSAFYKSVSLRLLSVLALQPEGRMTREGLYRTVIPGGFDGRIGILLSAGYVEEKGDKFMVTPSGLKLAMKLEKMRKVFSIEKCGIYFS